MLEKTLTSKIISTLNKIPSSMVRKRHAGPWRKGLADITGCIQGLHVEIEVKVGDNKPRKIQEKWLEKWEKAGALAGTAWSVEDAVRIVNKRGIYLGEIGETNQ